MSKSGGNRPRLAFKGGASNNMNKKPDLLLILAAVFSVGVLVSNYTMGEADPEQVAQGIVIR